MTLKEWLDKFKASGIDVHGHEELFLDLEDIIKEHDTFKDGYDGLQNELKEKDKSIQDLKDKCFRLFERQTNWDTKAEEELINPQPQDDPQPEHFKFEDMYEVTE